MIFGFILGIDPRNGNSCRVELGGGVKITFRDVGGNIKKSAIEGAHWVSDADYHEALGVAIREIYILKKKERRVRPQSTGQTLQLQLF